MDYNNFSEIFLIVLYGYAPLKKKVLSCIKVPFMNKILSKALMHRSKLKNRSNKNPTELSKSLYNKLRNYCVNLLKREKKKYYNDLDLKIFYDNTKFWRRIKPLFSDKNYGGQRSITIVENDLITDKRDVAEKLNNFVIESVENLEIEPFSAAMDDSSCSENIEGIIYKHKSHPSIKKIDLYSRIWQHTNLK